MLLLVYEAARSCSARLILCVKELNTSWSQEESADNLSLVMFPIVYLYTVMTKLKYREIPLCCSMNVEAEQSCSSSFSGVQHKQFLFSLKMLR